MALPDLADVAYVKTYAGVTGSATDAALQLLVTAASAFIRGETNRDITTNSYDIRRNGRGTFALLMPQYPITAVSTVEVDGIAIAASTGFTQPGYAFDDAQVVLRAYCFTRGLSNVRIAYTAGFAVAPDDVKLALAEIVQLEIRRRGSLEIASKSLANETISFNMRDIPSFARSTIDNYKRLAPL